MSEEQGRIFWAVYGVVVLLLGCGGVKLVADQLLLWRTLAQRTAEAVVGKALPIEDGETGVDSAIHLPDDLQEMLAREDEERGEP
jgi:hypothetical protein